MRPHYAQFILIANVFSVSYGSGFCRRPDARVSDSRFYCGLPDRSRYTRMPPPEFSVGFVPFKILLVMRKTVLVFMLAGCLAGCSKSPSELDGPTPPPGPGSVYSVNGSVQKGPYTQGTAITIQALDEKLNPTGKSYRTQISDDLGSFSLGSQIESPYVEILADGYYFDEVAGVLSASPLSLRSISDLGETGATNINLLTSLESYRVRHLVTEENMSIADARARADREIFAVFHIPDDILSDGGFDKLDIMRAGEANAALLAISATLQSTRSVAELTELVSKIAGEIQAGGTVKDASLREAVRSGGIGLDAGRIAQNLEERYEALGMFDYVIPNFEDYLDVNGDGIIDRDNVWLLTDDEIVVPPEGKTFPVKLRQNTEYTVAVEEGARSWLARTEPPTRAYLEEDELWFRAQPYGGDDERSGRITVSAVGGETSAVLTVIQKPEGSLTTTKGTFDVPQEGQVIDIEVLSNIEFEASVEESCRDWIVPVETRGIESYHLRYEVLDNPEVASRTGHIHITSGELEETVAVNQAGGYRISFNSERFELTRDAQPFTLAVSANFEYSMDIPRNGWLHDATPAGAPKGEYTFTVDENDTPDDRTAVIAFASADGEFSSGVTVVQSQSDMIISDPNTVNIDYKEQEFSVTVSANTEYDVSVSEGSGWLGPVNTRGLVSAELRFHAAKNPSKSPRTGIIRITDVSKAIVRDVKVIQGANTEPLAVNCPTPGALMAQMTADELRYTTDLCVTGSISSADVGYIASNMPALSTLDLNAADIQDGYLGDYDKPGEGRWRIGFEGPLVKLTLPRTLVRMGGLSASGLQEAVMFEGVERIEENAFSGCGSLASVKLPSSLTYIGDRAFGGLASLRELALPDGVKEIGREAFAGSGIRSVRIPAGVEVLESAFNGCTSLSQVTFAPGSRLRVMGSENPVSSGSPYFGSKYIPSGQLFFGCTSLSSIAIPASVETIGGNVFTGCTSLRSLSFEPGSRLKLLCGSTTKLTTGLSTTINYYGLFDNCALETVTLPASLASVGVAAFKNSAVREVKYENFSAVTEIGNEAFAGSEISSVKLYNGIAYGTRVYSDCLKLTLVELPLSGEAALPRGAFAGCANLRSVSVPAGCTRIYAAEPTEWERSSVFQGSALETVEFAPGSRLVSIGPEVFSKVTALKRIDLPAGLTELGAAAFYGCTSLSDVVLPAGLDVLPADAFGECPALRSVNTGHVASFGAAAFALGEQGAADFLVSVDLGSAVSIGDGCFSGRRALTSVSMPRTGTLALGNGVFSGTGITSIVVPKEIMRLERLGVDRPALFGDISVTFESGSALGNIPAGMFRGSDFSSIDLPRGLTQIGEEAFAECRNLGSVELHGGNSFDISFGAFRGCTSLRTVRMPSSSSVTLNDRLFEGCSLRSVVFPATIAGLSASSRPFAGAAVELAVFEPGIQIRAIPRELFRGSGLRAVEIAEGITGIDDYAFAECALAEVVVPASVSRLGGSCFSGSASLARVELPASGQLEIGSECFAGCTLITALEFPAAVSRLSGREVLKGSSVRSVTFASGSQLAEIGSGFFQNSPALTSVGLPAGISRIGSYAFSGCSGLKEVGMASGPTVIASGAFMNCTGLETLVLPSGTVAVEDEVFSGCTLLSSVSLPPTLSDIGSRAFSGCVSLREFVLPDCAELGLGYEAFSGCRFTELTVPSAVRKLSGNDYRSQTYTFSGSAVSRIIFQSGSQLSIVGDCAFAGAPLTDIELPEGVTDIQAAAFAACTQLRSVVLPSTVAALRGSRRLGTVFAGCTALRTLTCRMVVPARIDSDEFSDVDTTVCVLQVPPASVALYRNGSGDRAAWAKFATVTAVP